MADRLAIDLLISVRDRRLRLGKMATPIAEAFGISPAFLLNLEAVYVAARGKDAANT